MSEKLIIQLGEIRSALGGPGELKQAAEFVRSAAVLNCPVGFGELRQSIRTEQYERDNEYVAEVYTKKPYAHYVELGTGPKGMADHAGISPNVSPVYTPRPWWIHESQIDPVVAARYHFKTVTTAQGKFYLCYGQAAQPYLYPALKDNEQTVLKILADGYNKAMEEAR